MTSPEPPTYDLDIQVILARHLDAAALARLHRHAQSGGGDVLTALLHTAALRASHHHIHLGRTINHAISDLRAAAEELAAARPAEHLLTGRPDELSVAAHRHHDALTHLEAISRAYAATAEPSAP